MHQRAFRGNEAFCAALDRARFGYARPMKETDVCRTCGVVRAFAKGKCAHCHGEVGEHLVVPNGDDSAWVCLESAFQCRMCGFVVPLNHLDMDGAVTCGRCGLEQAFAVNVWADALAYAHAVADLFGETVAGLEGVEALGTRRSSLTFDVGGPNAFRATVSPGHPLCETCKQPVVVRATGDGTACVTCSACATEATYVVPNPARNMTKNKLRAALAIEHRSDRSAVKVEASAGAIAVQCPSCNAALPATEDSKFLTCGFCNTVSRIPDNLWFRLSGKEPKPEPVWLLFQGPSRMRVEAERRRLAEQRDAREGQARLDARQKRIADIERAGGERRANEERERARRADADREIEEEKKQSARDENASSTRFTVAVVVGSLLVGGGAIVYELIKKTPDSGAKMPTSIHDDGHGRVAVAPAPPQPPAARTSFVVPSCHCVARDGAGKNTFDLEVPAPTKHLWSIDWVNQAGFMTSTMPFDVMSSAGGVIPPSASTKAITLGMACDGTVVAFAAGKQASAWTGDDRKLLWNVTLPAAYVARAPDAAAPASFGGAVDVSCVALAVDSGTVTLDLASGKRVTIAMRDGKLK
ncbi:hypothetical protein BH09MYX1_BH09MYX1_36560 [soil metagenome]